MTDKPMKSIDQRSMAQMVSEKLGMPVGLVAEVIELEQKLTMVHIKKGYKVIKKNYLTLTPVPKDSFTMVSRLNGKTYTIPSRITVKLRLGQGFKTYVAGNGQKMPEKLCRFVDEKHSTTNTTSTTTKPKDTP